jgi:IS30 family transposase
MRLAAPWARTMWSFSFCWCVTAGSLRLLVAVLAEREDISRGIASGCSMRVIAQGLSRACSTVSREVARHGGRAQYRASEADQQAWESALRPKPCFLATHSKLQEIVASKLILSHNPKVARSNRAPATNRFKGLGARP